MPQKPKFINFFEKERRVQACYAMLSDYQGVYKQIITGDESWIYIYDPETTDKSSKYHLKGEAKPKRPCQSFENQGDADSFLRLPWCCVLRIPSNWPNLQQEILFKRYPELWPSNSWI